MSIRVTMYAVNSMPRKKENYVRRRVVYRLWQGYAAMCKNTREMRKLMKRYNPQGWGLR